MRTIFWDVDTQLDFLSPQGKLYVPGSELIIPNLRRLTEYARLNGILVISSACAHRPDDEEFAIYPPHCLVGTPGQAKIPETRLDRQVTVPNHEAELPPDIMGYQQIVVEKQKLDVFTNPNMEKVLGRVGGRLEVVLYGIVTELCLQCAARELLDRGHKVRLVRDAVHHIDEQKGQELFKFVQTNGGEVVTTEDVTSRAREGVA